MKRAVPLFITLLPLLAVTALSGACSEDANSGSATSDAGNDRRAARPTPTAEEEEEDAPACARGDITAVTPPADYGSRQNPLTVTTDVIEAGGEQYANRCALCHGAQGRGDGKEGPFDPVPANLTMRRRSDAYLFWRISEGGESPPFCSAMPAFESLYTDTQRWQLVAFIQETFAPKLDAGGDAADAD